MVSASGKGVSLRCPSPLPRRAILSFDLVLGARPLPVMARVMDWKADWHPEEGNEAYIVELEFVALAQVDRDTLVDFVQAVGVQALRARPQQE